MAGSGRSIVGGEPTDCSLPGGINFPPVYNGHLPPTEAIPPLFLLPSALFLSLPRPLHNRNSQAGKEEGTAGRMRQR